MHRSKFSEPASVTLLWYALENAALKHPKSQSKLSGKKRIQVISTCFLPSYEENSQMFPKCPYILEFKLSPPGNSPLSNDISCLFLQSGCVCLLVGTGPDEQRLGDVLEEGFCPTSKLRLGWLQTCVGDMQREKTQWRGEEATLGPAR